MLLLNKENIKSIYNMKDAIESVKEAFSLYSKDKCANPLRTNIQVEKHKGALLFMPSYVEDTNYAALKVINIYPKNIELGLPTSYAQVILIDASTGDIVSLLDGNYLTQLRTGAASGACFDVLARKDAKIGALIGTGGQAVTQLEAMLNVRDLDMVKIYDSSESRLNKFVEDMKREFGSFRTEIVAAKSSDDAIENADLLITVTPSPKPVFDGSKCKKGITISCIGSYQPHMQEMDPEILKRASKIYFDSKSAVMEEAGDILIPLREGIIKEDDITGELGQVINGKLVGRENDDEIIVFKTVGIGVQDLTTARSIYESAVENDIGSHWI